MDRSSNSPLPVSPRDPVEQSIAPSETPSDSVEPAGDSSPGLRDNDRADLVLFLGIVSLLMCGVLGIVPWIMANSDLKSIRSGKMSDRRAGTLKVGRALGIGGTFVFLLSLGVAVAVLYRGLDVTEGGNGWPELLIGPTPIPADKIVFAGEWMGHRGSVLRINADGTGDFRGRETRLQSGRVIINERSISIGASGTSKVWTIERIPSMKDGTWTMKLNGEIFRRRTRGLTVERVVDPEEQVDGKHDS